MYVLYVNCPSISELDTLVCIRMYVGVVYGNRRAGPYLGIMWHLGKSNSHCLNCEFKKSPVVSIQFTFSVFPEKLGYQLPKSSPPLI